jgi:hypothetical protein
MIIRFTPEADAEVAEARQWYAHHHYLRVSTASGSDRTNAQLEDIIEPFTSPTLN